MERARQSIEGTMKAWDRAAMALLCVVLALGVFALKVPFPY
jgi:hypothetical protein